MHSKSQIDHVSETGQIDSDLSGKAVPQALPEHRQLRSGLCCAIAASRGHACAAERATLHLVLNALNGTAADATLSSDQSQISS